MIRVTGSGHEHAATQVVCVSSSDWRGDVSSVTDAATRLCRDQGQGEICAGRQGEDHDPSSPEARALVSVESGSVVRKFLDRLRRQTDRSRYRSKPEWLPTSTPR
ncbi:MAG: hypothetical protein ACLRMJ_12930 [Alistipes finegoldii]